MTFRQVWLIKRYCYPSRLEEAGKWKRPFMWPYDGYPLYNKLVS